VLLHCGDHDSGGLHISDFLRSNLADVSVATADWENRNNPDIDYLSREPWDPANLHIDRVGLNYDLVVRPEAGRALCRRAILCYVPGDRRCSLPSPTGASAGAGAERDCRVIVQPSAPEKVRADLVNFVAQVGRANKRGPVADAVKPRPGDAASRPD
jgi:hypothetical protein